MNESSAPLLLLIEDDPQMRKFLRHLLASHHYRLVEAESGLEGMQQATTRNPDLILLDLGLPDLDGLELTTRLREWCRTPIIVLSARGMEEDKVKALDRGADDYLTKPFGARELLARLRVALRHAALSQHPSAETEFSSRGLRLDFVARRIWRDDTEIHLTPTEYKLLCFFLQNQGRVLTHRQILQGVWGPGQTHQLHYVRVYLAQLRRKIEADPTQPEFLLTETGIGYRFQTEET